jgi:FkbM family methyltransferase
VEPVPYVFKRLVSNYAGCVGLSFENAAVANRTGVRELLYLKETEEALPNYYDQIGSLKPNVIMKHAASIPNFHKHLAKITVNTITLSDLLAKYSVEKIDLLHIDAEGYDFEIIKQLDFQRFTPALILFEHKHLDVTENMQCKQYLRALNYRLVVEAGNTAACRFTLPKQYTVN